MTHQIAIQARDGFVFASDEKVISSEDQWGPHRRPHDITFQSKIRIVHRHRIAIGIAGNPNPAIDPLQACADHISLLDNFPDDAAAVIREWAEGFKEKHRRKHGAIGWFSLLIVNPISASRPMWRAKLSDSDACNPAPGRGYRINGNETLSTIVWPEYSECGHVPFPNVAKATNVAALTILMGRDVNSGGVSGLEIWKYTDTWTRVDDAEINAIGDRYRVLKSHIDSFIHAPQPVQQDSKHDL